MRKPLQRGLRDGLVAAALGALLILGIQEGLRRQESGERTARADELARALADGAADWILERRRVTRLLADQIQEPLLEEGATLPRAPLAQLHRAYPGLLRAAAILDGNGLILASGEAWREGSRPVWAGGPGAAGVVWEPGPGGGVLVIREGMVAPPSRQPPLWLVTSWEAAGMAPMVERNLAGQPGSVARVLEAGGETVLQVPAIGRTEAQDHRSRVPLGPAGLELLVAVPGVGPRPLWPLGFALVMGLVVGLLGAGAAGRLAVLDRELAGAVLSAARGQTPGGGTGRLALLPEVVEALKGLKRHGGTEAGREEALTALQGRLRGAVVLVTDATGKVELTAGDPAVIFGAPPEDVVGAGIRRLLTPASWEALAPILARASLQGEGAQIEVELSREREGGVVELTVAGRGERGGYVLLARDAGAWRKLRERLSVAEERYRALSEGMQDGLVLVQDGVIESANPAFARLLGLSVTEVVGTPLTRHVAPSDLLVVAERLQEAEPSPGTFDLRLTRADSLEPLEARAALNRRDDGQVLVVVRDEGDRRRFERLLTRAHRRLDATLDATSDAILALEPRAGERRVVFANRAFAELLGVSTEEVCRRDEQEVTQALVTRGVLPNGFQDWIRRLQDAPGARSSERFESPTEPRRTLELQAAPLELPGGPGRVISIRDVTPQADAERRLRRDHDVMQARREILEQANRELERVNLDLESRTTELHRVNRGLKQLDEMRSNLLANVSHELQTPLVSIRGYTEMILKGKIGPVTQEQQRGLEISLKNIDRLIGLIDNLLEFSRAEGGLTELQLSSFHLKELVSEVLELLRDVAERRSVRLQASYPGGDPCIRGDREGVAQVLMNLVSNAIKFNREGGEVSVDVQSPRRGFARVRVQDSGRGIPPEDLERVFERYYRVPAETGEEVAGSGLGLSIVRQILQVHGCTIRAESSPEGGTIFTFTLPLAREDSDTEVPRAERRPSASRAES